jgi:hypothetical protein
MNAMLLRNTFGLIAAGLVFTLAHQPARAAEAAGGEQAWPPAGVSLNGDPKVPDISGIWLGSGTGIPGQGVQNNTGSSADGRPPAYWGPWPIPYTPEYKKIFEERAKALKEGRALGDQGAQCLPFGPALNGGGNYPEEITQTPGRVAIWIWQGAPTIVWTDGRGHPKDLKPTYKGHSIGHWAGDTLFIDTVGMKAGPFAPGGAHGDKLHYKTMITPVGKDILHIVLTAYDEDAFMEPLTMTSIFHRKSDTRWQVLDDSSCFENNKEVIDSQGSAGFPKF